MNRRSGGLFAGRGIALPAARVTLLTVLVCFVVGIGAGWVTTQLPTWYRDWTAAPEPTVSASPSASATPEVSVPALAPITRELDGDDAAAGVITTTVPERGEGTFSPATGPAGTTPEPDPELGPTRFVRVDVEDGIAVDADALVTSVMATLNDPRGWGSAGRMQFVLTEGAADVRIVLATPYTIALKCPEVHTPGTLDGVAGASPSPSADASVVVPCATQGIAPISIYDWTAGLPRYGDNRVGAREYLVNHGVGHVLGEPDATCDEGKAAVMVDQNDMPKACKVNPWPFPDAEKSG